MNITKIVITFLLLSLSLSLSLSCRCYSFDENGKSFIDDKSRGWFWYEINSSTEDEAPENKELNIDLTKNYSAQELKELIPKALEYALDNPEPKFVLQYFYLQKLALDKSEKFAQVSKSIPLLDASYDEMSKREYNRDAMFIVNNEKLQSNLKNINEFSDKFGIIFVYKGNCQYCRLAIPQVQFLKSLGFKIIGISIDGVYLDKDIFIKSLTVPNAQMEFGINSVPSFIVADLKEKNKRAIVSTSLLSNSELINRLYLAVDMFK
ncbi:MAG: conjugal transfer protein TraF, partial [Succinivibrionaceae bacterium]